ncbi:hypothetical protein, no similarity [Maudiozyma barnettii]|uniref:PA14 domain-containing protein n=1 Tax=Maudiozyma barnettii TaxID=61262 RepID=A0A8H2VKH8_9SACH|nr:hypothetical protein, no similarity [Kazachstania barnettii]CAB4257255.1 hypothetical protein, no similarity [Kazachstania barnettii]CAD1779625.1 hypothetical protein, no similarity [Kazachstania barnettii]
MISLLEKILLFITLLTKWVSSNLPDCKMSYVAPTSPGFTYYLYEIPLNGVPYYFDDLSPLQMVYKFYILGQPIYQSTTLNMAFRLNQYIDNETIMQGTLYGNSITITNFSMVANAWIRVDKTGYYTFIIDADYAAAMFIANDSAILCTSDPFSAPGFNLFYISSSVTQPKQERTTGTILLYAGIPYEMGLSYIHPFGTPNFQVSVIDPEGQYHPDISYLLSTLNVYSNGVQPTLDYELVNVTSADGYSGLSTTLISVTSEATSSIGGKLTVTSIYYIGTPTVSSQISSVLTSSRTIDNSTNMINSTPDSVTSQLTTTVEVIPSSGSLNPISYIPSSLNTTTSISQTVFSNSSQGSNGESSVPIVPSNVSSQSKSENYTNSNTSLSPSVSASLLPGASLQSSVTKGQYMWSESVASDQSTTTAAIQGTAVSRIFTNTSVESLTSLGDTVLSGSLTVFSSEIGMDTSENRDQSSVHSDDIRTILSSSILLSSGIENIANTSTLYMSKDGSKSSLFEIIPQPEYPYVSTQTVLDQTYVVVVIQCSRCSNGIQTVTREYLSDNNNIIATNAPDLITHPDHISIGSRIVPGINVGDVKPTNVDISSTVIPSVPMVTIISESSVSVPVKETSDVSVLSQIPDLQNVAAFLGIGHLSSWFMCIVFVIVLSF